MKKSLLILPLLVVSLISARADNNPSNNNSAKQFKTGNRNASTEAEAAFYNPAGTVFGRDGLTLEFSVLPFTSTQKIFDSGLDKEYSSTAYSYFYPAFNYTYKKEKWAMFGNIGVTNGGGAGDYKDGLPGFTYLGYNYIILGAAGGLLPSGDLADYNVQNSFSGSALGLGGSIGFAYRLSDWLSASAAFQYSKQSNHTEGELIIDYLPGSMEVGRTELDYDETGSNMGFIFGLNVKPNEKLLIANTFRYYTELELETSVNDNKNGNDMIVDGSKRLATYVPYYSLGISYVISPELRIEGDMNLSLYSMLELDKDAEDVDMANYYNNGIDVGLGLEYQVSELINWGVGFTFAPRKLKDEYQNEMEFENTSLWLNTGTSIAVTEHLGFDLSLQFGVPTEEYKSSMDPFNEALFQKYSKGVSYALGLGVHYSF